jgi:hypothetical protein
MSRRIGQIMLVIAGLLFLPAGPVSIFLYCRQSAEVARLPFSVPGQYYQCGTLLLWYVMGFGIAIALLTIPMLHYSRNSHRGLQVSGLLDAGASILFGMLAMRGGGDVRWVVAFFGYIVLAYLDYLFRWWATSGTPVVSQI